MARTSSDQIVECRLLLMAQIRHDALCSKQVAFGNANKKPDRSGETVSRSAKRCSRLFRALERNITGHSGNRRCGCERPLCSRHGQQRHDRASAGRLAGDSYSRRIPAELADVVRTHSSASSQSRIPRLGGASGSQPKPSKPSR